MIDLQEIFNRHFNDYLQKYRPSREQWKAARAIMSCRTARLGAHIATVPYATLVQMLNHPLTDSGIERFLKDWETVAK